jgi:hypothetical protein
LAMLGLIAGVAAGCSGGAATFALTGASVDASYDCPSGATDALYIFHGMIDMTNGTSSSVTFKSITAVMTLVAVKGPWLEKVGDKYAPSGVISYISTLAAGGSASAQVIIPSSCTRAATTATEASYGEYSVGFTVTTNAGTYSVLSSNHHRIIGG